MAIYLIRHGETALNATRVIQTGETPLSTNGLAQADRLGERLAAVGITRIFASDYARADMTAQAVASRSGVSIETKPLLRERHLGDLRGRAYADLGFDPFAPEYVPPNGESWEVFHARVDDAWAEVADAAEKTDGHLAVVTHGLVCMSVVTRLADLPADLAANASGWLNTSVTILDDETPWTVRLLNCAEHLDHAEAKGPA